MKDEKDKELIEGKKVLLKILSDFDLICKKNNLKYWLEGGTLLGAARHKGFIPWDDDIDVAMPRKDYNKFIKIASKDLPENLFLQNCFTDKGSYWPWIKLRDRNSKFIEQDAVKKMFYYDGIFIDIFPMDSFKDSGSLYKKKKNLMTKMAAFLLRYKMIPFKTVVEEVFNEGRGLKQIVKLIIILLVKIITIFLGNDKMYLLLLRARKRCLKTVGGNNKIGYALEVPWDITFDMDTVYPLGKIKFEGKQFNAPNNVDRYLKQSFGDYMTIPPKEERVWHFIKIKTNITEEEKKIQNSFIKKGKYDLM